jgi:hypothetical protein
MEVWGRLKTGGGERKEASGARAEKRGGRASRDAREQALQGRGKETRKESQARCWEEEREGGSAARSGRSGAARPVGCQAREEAGRAGPARGAGRGRPERPETRPARSAATTRPDRGRLGPGLVGLRLASHNGRDMRAWACTCSKRLLADMALGSSRVTTAAASSQGGDSE